MTARTPPNSAQHGFGMVEVLVSILIIAIGLLGIAGLQARATSSEFESYQRSQAVSLAFDMSQRIRTNRANMGYFKAISDVSDGSGFVGSAGSGQHALVCPPADPLDRAGRDLCEWQDLLLGVAEKKAGNNIGAMADARGCIFYDATTEVGGAPDSGVFTVAVSWLGSQEMSEPVASCGDGLYGTEGRRRTLVLNFRMANLK